jgi:hypothetical protein
MRFLQAVRADYHWLVGNGAAELGVNDIETSATFAFPILYNTKFPLLVTPGFGIHLFDGPVTNPALGLDLPGAVYDAYLEAGWAPQILPWLGADLAARYGVYTDFSGLDTQSLRLTGHGYALFSLAPSVQAKAGVIYFDRVEIKLLPAGGVIWTPNPDVRLDILFPDPKLARRLTTIGNTDWWVYFRGQYGDGSWTVRHREPPGNPAGIEQIDYNDIRLAIGLEGHGLRGTTGYVEIGGAFDREIVYRDHPTDTFRPDPTVFVGAGLVY